MVVSWSGNKGRVVSMLVSDIKMGRLVGRLSRSVGDRNCHMIAGGGL